MCPQGRIANNGAKRTTASIVASCAIIPYSIDMSISKFFTCKTVIQIPIFITDVLHYSGTNTSRDSVIMRQTNFDLASHCKSIENWREI